jgi:hypothetical protein
VSLIDRAEQAVATRVTTLLGCSDGSARAIACTALALAWGVLWWMLLVGVREGVDRVKGNR